MLVHVILYHFPLKNTCFVLLCRFLLAKIRVYLEAFENIIWKLSAFRILVEVISFNN